MKTKRLLLFILLTAVSVLTAYGQIRSKNKNKPVSEMTMSIDSLQIEIDSLRVKLSIKDSLIAERENIIDKYKTCIKSLRDSMSFIIDENNNRILSIRDSTKKEILVRDKELSELKANAGWIDTCMVKLANERLNKKFNKVEVDEAIKHFDRIYSGSVKRDYSIVQQLLRGYERAYYKFQTILKQAQNDDKRTYPLDFEVDAYKNKYIKDIETMPYYIQYYNSDWNIIYLNEKITEALKCLNSHSNKSPADFTPIIENL